MDSEDLLPSQRRVRQIFTSIAGRYDVVNRLLSGGTDVFWRQRLVREICSYHPQSVVDLATGSGDVALALRRDLGEDVAITGLDFCEAMLDTARKKQAAALGSGVNFCLGDCCNLPFANGTVDVLSIAFGLRNLEDRERGLREMRRVLRPGGALFILEFSKPFRWVRPFHSFYLRVIVPRLGGWITGNRDAYAYLSGSIEAFPDRATLIEEIRAAGFNRIEAFPLSLGVVALYRAGIDYE